MASHFLEHYTTLIFRLCLHYLIQIYFYSYRTGNYFIHGMVSSSKLNMKVEALLTDIQLLILTLGYVDHT
jgi:hypothetical protein